MGFLTYFWRDVEQIMFPMREQHAIPSMDGALSPNDRLDACSPIGEPIGGADDVVEGPDGALYVSGGSQVWRLAGESYLDRRIFAGFEGNAGGLAFHPDGRLLVCVSGHGLAAVDGVGKQTWLRLAGDQRLDCLTSVAAAPDGNIFLCDGSSQNLAEDCRPSCCATSLIPMASALRGMKRRCGLPKAGAIASVMFHCRDSKSDR